MSENELERKGRLLVDPHLLWLQGIMEGCVACQRSVYCAPARLPMMKRA